MPAKNYTVSLGQHPFDQRGGIDFGKVGIGRHQQRTPGARAAAADFFHQSRGRAVLPLVARGDVLEGWPHDALVAAVTGKAQHALREIALVSPSDGKPRNELLLAQAPMASLGVSGNPWSPPH